MSARVVALGSADAFCAAGRGHTCWLLEDARGLALIDFGATGLLALARLGIDPERIDSVHFTHLHGDHIAGWPFLLLDALYLRRRTRPLQVTGPAGTRERLASLFAACYADTAGRGLPFALDICELAPGDAREICGRRVTAFRAQHMRPPHVALSLRIDGPAGALAFTGDTGAHEGLDLLSRGADALFAECTELHAPALAADSGHLSWDELRLILPRLGVPRIALAHLGAAVRAAAHSIEIEARALGLSLTVCDDLTEIPLGRD